MSDYNYKEFSTQGYDFSKSEGPNVGQKAQNFKLETVSGEFKNILDFEGDFLVFEMGSRTCPLFQGRRKKMKSFLDNYKNVSASILYVREAHPGDIIKAHKSYEDKKLSATALKNIDKEHRTIFIDGFDGKVHQAYGSKPDAVYIIDKAGFVRFKSDWNNPIATHKALKQLIDNKKVTAKNYFYPVNPIFAISILANAGKGSKSDFFRGLPFLIWTNVIKRNIKILIGKIKS
jgi:hypothetical protein